MTEQQKMARRKFLKYAGAGVVVVAAAGGAYYYATIPSPTPGPTSTSTPTLTVSSTGGATTAPAGAPIKVGVTGPMTGPQADYGEEMHNGALMAVNDINAKGGLLGSQLELVPFDTQTQAAELIDAGFTKLVTQDKVSLIVTSWTGNAPYDIQLAEKLKVPFIHGDTEHLASEYCASHPDTTWMAWMIDAPEYGYGDSFLALLKWMEEKGYHKFNKKTFFVVTREYGFTEDTSNYVQKVLTQNGWTLISNERVLTGTVEWGAINAKIRQAEPELIYFIDDVVTDAGAWWKQFGQNPTNSLIYMHVSPGVPEFHDIVGSTSADGLIWGVLQGLIPCPEMDAWADRYNKTFNAHVSNFCAEQSYDGVMIWATAAQRAGTVDPVAVCAEIKKMSDPTLAYRGTMGRYIMDPVGHYVPCDRPDAAPAQYLQVWNKQSTLIFPSELTQYYDGVRISDYKKQPWLK
jgi:branched-chain amino acid transport system substrate-binding protein